MSSNESRVFSNVLWRFMERVGAQLVQFIVSIVLARILLPEDFGIVALVVVIASVFQVFVDSGLGNALIQKKNSDDIDFSSVFYFNMILCVVLYGALFFVSPSISAFFDQAELTPVLRVLGLIVVVSGIKNIQQAYVSKTMQFRKFFFATIIGTIISAVVGVILALNGAGVWALVAQRLTNLTVDTLVLWITVDWRPKKAFSLDRLKELLKYGWKLSVSSLINTLYGSIRSFIIGKQYTEADLGYYNQGEQVPMVIGTNINRAIDSVLFPVMSENQDDPQKVKAITRKTLKTSIYILAPLMVGLSVCSKEIIPLFFTEKWNDAIPFLAVFAIIYMFFPFHTANLNAIKAMGRSDIFLSLEAIKFLFDLLCLIVAFKFGPFAIALSLLVSDVISQVINSFPNRKLISYGYLEQLKDISAELILAFVMGGIVLLVKLLNFGLVLTLILEVIVGVIIYVTGSVFFKLESYKTLIGILKGFSKEEKDNG